MSDTFNYFDPSSLNYGDNTQWEHSFEEQNGDSSYTNGVAADGTSVEQHEVLMRNDATEASGSGHRSIFNDPFIDPAIWLNSSDVPWPSIEQHEPLNTGTDAIVISAQPVHDLNQQSPPGDLALPDQNRWHNHDASQSLGDWNTPVEDFNVQPSNSEQPDARVDDEQGRAPIANMQNFNNDSTPLDSTREQQQTQQHDVSRLWIQDAQIAQTDHHAHHSFNHAQSGLNAALNAQDMTNLPFENERYNIPRMPNQPYPQGYNFDDLSFTQIPSHKIHLAYHEQSFSPDLASTDLDPDYIPDRSFSPDLFSPSEFSPEPESGRKKPRTKRQHNKSPNPNVTIMKTSLPCIAPGCGRPFRNRTHILDLCNRCARKHDRRTAEAQPNNLDPEVPDLQSARKLIYPPQLPRGPPIPPIELEDILRREDVFIQKFLDAVNEVVPGGEGGDVKEEGLTWEMRQQITLNQKLRMEGESRKGEEGAYRRSLITARLRALFLETYQFHTGTQECFYAIGGNNAGYNPDCQLSFQERFELICELLKKNKRMVMDVIEGRGVKSVVANPKGYNKRKVSNNLCNEDKKEIMGKGKARVQEGTGTKKRRRRNGKLDTVVEEESGYGEAGPSKRVKRATRSSAAGKTVGQEDLMEMELREALRRDSEGDVRGFDFGFDLDGFDARSNTFA